MIELKFKSENLQILRWIETSIGTKKLPGSPDSHKTQRDRDQLPPRKRDLTEKVPVGVPESKNSREKPLSVRPKARTNKKNGFRGFRQANIKSRTSKNHVTNQRTRSLPTTPGTIYSENINSDRLTEGLFPSLEELTYEEETESMQAIEISETEFDEIWNRYDNER